MNSHLVTVKVGVKGRADERVKLDSLAFNQDRLERLNTQTVKCWCAVQQHRVLADNLIEDVPNFLTFLFDPLLGLLQGHRKTLRIQTRVDERLEQFERHLLWQAALMQFQFRTGHDNRTTRIIDALTQKVLTETALLALEHVGQRLQWTLVGASDRTAATAIVEQCVNSFLQHALFVADDDVWRAQFDQALQTVVTVDNAAIEIVQIGRCKTATIQRHQWAQFWWNDGNDVQNHPLGLVA